MAYAIGVFSAESEAIAKINQKICKEKIKSFG